MMEAWRARLINKHPNVRPVQHQTCVADGEPAERLPEKGNLSQKGERDVKKKRHEKVLDLGKSGSPSGHGKEWWARATLCSGGGDPNGHARRGKKRRGTKTCFRGEQKWKKCKDDVSLVLQTRVIGTKRSQTRFPKQSWPRLGGRKVGGSDIKNAGEKKLQMRGAPRK